MRINPKAFFNFCSTHVPLLQALAERPGDLSETDVRQIIRSKGTTESELPENTWRRLKELQILVPVEPGSDFYFMADPVRRLVAYLFDDARAATPEIIRGYIQSLEALDKQLARAIDGDDLTTVRLALEEMQQTLRRVQADLDETHRCILTEIARHKTERQSIPAREKFRRIVHWMERYVDPMVEMVRPDGVLRATFDETERLLHLARENGLFNDLSALERNLRLLRLVQRHALRVFQQCRRELQPLYESLRRASFIAEGAALALESLGRDGLDGWAARCGVGNCLLRWQHAPSDAAIERAFKNIIEHPVEPAPVLGLDAEEKSPEGYMRRVWIEGLSSEVRAALPVPDLLGWLAARHPNRDTADLLTGFTRLVFHAGFEARFNGGETRTYQTADGALEAEPVELAAHE